MSIITCDLRFTPETIKQVGLWIGDLSLITGKVTAELKRANDLRESELQLESQRLEYEISHGIDTKPVKKKSFFRRGT